MKYDAPIPHSRGMAVPRQALLPQTLLPQVVTTPAASASDVRDVIIYALIARVAYTDNSTAEFLVRLVNGTLDIDIDQTLLDKMTAIIASSKVQQFFQWLTGVSQAEVTALQGQVNALQTAATPAVTTVLASASIAATPTFLTVLANASAGPINLVLPAPAPSLIRNIKKVDTTVNPVVVLPHATELVETQNSLSISTPLESYQLVSDGANWYAV